MHVCYLRVAGGNFDVDGFLSRSRMLTPENITKWRKGEPFRRGERKNSGFMFEICEVESEGIEEPATKAIDFLRGNFEELKHLMEQADGADSYLQFVIDKRDVANQNDLFPAELVRLAGSLGLGILLSKYSE
jgi:hypothetical protein